MKAVNQFVFSSQKELENTGIITISLEEALKLNRAKNAFFVKTEIQFRANEKKNTRIILDEIDLNVLDETLFSVEEKILELETFLDGMPLGEEIILGNYDFQGFETPLPRGYTNKELYEIEGLRLQNLMKSAKENSRIYKGVVRYNLTKESLSDLISVGLVECKSETKGEKTIFRLFRSEKTSLDLAKNYKKAIKKQYRKLYFKNKELTEKEVLF